MSADHSARKNADGLSGGSASGALGSGAASRASAIGAPRENPDAATGEATAWNEPSSWHPLLERTPLLPDTPHRFRIGPADPCDLVRLDVFPDGGVARLRLYGSLTPEGLAQIRRRWAETAP
jgi:hypothetical protein